MAAGEATAGDGGRSSGYYYGAESLADGDNDDDLDNLEDDPNVLDQKGNKLARGLSRRAAEQMLDDRTADAKTFTKTVEAAAGQIKRMCKEDGRSDTVEEATRQRALILEQLLDLYNELEELEAFLKAESDVDQSSSGRAAALRIGTRINELKMVYSRAMDQMKACVPSKRRALGRDE